MVKIEKTLGVLGKMMVQSYMKWPSLKHDTRTLNKPGGEQIVTERSENINENIS